MILRLLLATLVASEPPSAEDCVAWAEAGECENNTPYMSNHCKKACEDVGSIAVVSDAVSLASGASKEKADQDELEKYVKDMRQELAETDSAAEEENKRRLEEAEAEQERIAKEKRAEEEKEKEEQKKKEEQRKKEEEEEEKKLKEKEAEEQKKKEEKDEEEEKEKDRQKQEEKEAEQKKQEERRKLEEIEAEKKLQEAEKQDLEDLLKEDPVWKEDDDPVWKEWNEWEREDSGAATPGEKRPEPTLGRNVMHNRRADAASSDRRRDKKYAPVAEEERSRGDQESTTSGTRKPATDSDGSKGTPGSDAFSFSSDQLKRGTVGVFDVMQALWQWWFSQASEICVGTVDYVSTRPPLAFIATYQIMFLIYIFITRSFRSSSDRPKQRERQRPAASPSAPATGDVSALLPYFTRLEQVQAELANAYQQHAHRSAERFNNIETVMQDMQQHRTNVDGEIIESIREVLQWVTGREEDEISDSTSHLVSPSTAEVVKAQFEKAQASMDRPKPTTEGFMVNSSPLPKCAQKALGPHDSVGDAPVGSPHIGDSVTPMPRTPGAPGGIHGPRTPGPSGPPGIHAPGTPGAYAPGTPGVHAPGSPVAPHPPGGTMTPNGTATPGGPCTPGGAGTPGGVDTPPATHIPGAAEPLMSPSQSSLNGDAQSGVPRASDPFAPRDTAQRPSASPSNGRPSGLGERSSFVPAPLESDDFHSELSGTYPSPLQGGVPLTPGGIGTPGSLPPLMSPSALDGLQSSGGPMFQPRNSVGAREVSHGRPPSMPSRSSGYSAPSDHPMQSPLGPQSGSAGRVPPGPRPMGTPPRPPGGIFRPPGPGVRAPVRPPTPPGPARGESSSSVGEPLGMDPPADAKSGNSWAGAPEDAIDSPGPVGRPPAFGGPPNRGPKRPNVRPQQQEIKAASNPFGRPPPQEIKASSNPFGPR